MIILYVLNVLVKIITVPYLVMTVVLPAIQQESVKEEYVDKVMYSI